MVTTTSNSAILTGILTGQMAVPAIGGAGGSMLTGTISSTAGSCGNVVLDIVPVTTTYSEEVILHHNGTGAQAVNDLNLKRSREAMDEKIKTDGYIRTSEFYVKPIEYETVIDYQRVRVECDARACLRSLDGPVKCRTCRSKRRFQCITS